MAETEDLEKLAVSELMMRLLEQCWGSGLIAELLKRARTLPEDKSYTLEDKEYSREASLEYRANVEVGCDYYGDAFIRIESREIPRDR